MASIQNVFFRTYMRLVAKKDKQVNYTTEEVRESIIKLTNMSPIPRGVEYESVKLNGIEAEWVIPNNIENNGVVLFSHGGAYVAGSVDTHKALVGRLALASKTKFISVEYGLAPEKPFPHGLEDIIKIYNLLINKGFDHKKIIFAGDSAGGGLSICALIKLKDDGAPQPAGAAVMSPWLDLTCSQDSAVRLADEDVFVSVAAAKNCAKQYAENDLTNPYASPLYADPTGLPPIYIQVSNSETLLDENIKFFENSKNAGVDIKIERLDKMIHVWQGFAPFLPEANEAIEKIGVYIEKKTK